MRKQKKPITAGKQKAMLFIGVFLVTVALFMGSFAFSMQMILNPVDDKSSEEKSLAEENQRLKQELNLLQDQYDVLEAKQSKKPTPTKAPEVKKSTFESYDDDYDDDYEDED